MDEPCKQAEGQRGTHATWCALTRKSALTCDCGWFEQEARGLGTGPCGSREVLVPSGEADVRARLSVLDARVAVLDAQVKSLQMAMSKGIPDVAGSIPAGASTVADRRGSEAERGVDPGETTSRSSGKSPHSFFQEEAYAQKPIKAL